MQGSACLGAALETVCPPCPPCSPLAAARGGEVRMKSGIKNIELNEDGSVK